MNRLPLGRAAIVAAVLVVSGILENTFFGSDTAGTAKHDVSVAFFFVTLVGVVALLAIGMLALVRRTRTRASY